MKHLKLLVALLALTLTAACADCPMHKMMQHGKSSNTQATPAAAEGTYTCPMHPQVSQDKPGNCPICGMKLVEKK